MSLISMFTRSRISEGPKPSPFEPDRLRSPQRAYKDYSTRLVSVSWHQLDDEGAAARIASDFNNDFLWIRGPSGFQEYYGKPDAVPLRQLAKLEYEGTAWFPVFQIDLLRPTHDYIDLRSGGRDYAILLAEKQFEDAMRSLGIMPNWWTICCSTMNDHPMSAYRRSIMVLEETFTATMRPMMTLSSPSRIRKHSILSKTRWSTACAQRSNSRHSSEPKEG